jgi:transcriptional regulator with XRE-family HTH domain
MGSETKTRVDEVEVTYAMVLGEILREYREDMSVTQIEMSKLSGLPQPTVSRVERGRSDPSLSTLRAMATGIAVPLGDLLKLADSRWRRL